MVKIQKKIKVAAAIGNSINVIYQFRIYYSQY